MKPGGEIVDDKTMKTVGAAADCWLPARTKKEPAKGTVSLAVLGDAGVGKSHLLRQLVETHPEYRGRVIAYMTENSVATYGEDYVSRGWIHVCPVYGGLLDAKEQLEELRKAGEENKKLPLLGFFDSISGGADGQQKYFRQFEPHKTEAGKRHIQAEYGDLGRSIMEIMATCRDELAMDMVLLCTTKRRSKDVCVEGNLTPDHFTRLTNVCLRLEAEMTRYSPGDVRVEPAPYRTIGLNEKGEPMGIYVDRFFTCMNTGEIEAKGHRALGLREKAILGNVLAKIHGKGERS